MTLHLGEISAAVAPDAHAIVIHDQPGWHLSNALIVPDNITLMPPPKSPELNPVENIWQFTRDNWLSKSIFKSIPTSSIIAASLGTSSPSSPGPSSPSDYETGRINDPFFKLVLVAVGQGQGPRASD